MPLENFINPLRKMREFHGLSQQDVERLTGVQQATISRAERGYPIYRTPAEALVKFFGFPLNELHLIYPERFLDKDAAA